jgi:hypothetical protein
MAASRQTKSSFTAGELAPDAGAVARGAATEGSAAGAAGAALSLRASGRIGVARI